MNEVRISGIKKDGAMIPRRDAAAHPGYRFSLQLASGKMIDYFSVSCWDTAAVEAESFANGDEVIVEGRLKVERWQDKHTGEYRSKVAITAETVKSASGETETGF